MAALARAAAERHPRADLHLRSRRRHSRADERSTQARRDRQPQGHPVNRSAKTPDDYIASLPDDRRTAVADVRKLVNKHLPAGFAEQMLAGMISWVVPLKRLPKTYNGQPLMYVALAAQKNYCSLYLMSAYGSKKHEAELR